MIVVLQFISIFIYFAEINNQQIQKKHKVKHIGKEQREMPKYKKVYESDFKSIEQKCMR